MNATKILKYFIPTRARTVYTRAQKTVQAIKSHADIGEVGYVRLGWKTKDANGKPIEAVLHSDLIEKIPNYAKNSPFGMFTALILGLGKKAKVTARSISAVPDNVMKAKAASIVRDALVEDKAIPLPSLFAKLTRNPKSLAGRFYNSLKLNKNSLMKDLSITSEEYDSYAALALKISKEESKCGKSLRYLFYDFIERRKKGFEILSYIRNKKSGDPSLSLGMTRFKISKATAEEKALFSKYGITFENNNSNIIEPEKSAVATIIHLSKLAKGYSPYLAQARELLPEMNNPSIRYSINNAKRILFNDKLRPKAIEALRQSGNGIEQVSEITLKDLDDLRIYASSVVLSKDAYLAARWNGRVVLPIGEKKDIACANLLKTAAQKGYIPNIDKTSNVIY